MSIYHTTADTHPDLLTTALRASADAAASARTLLLSVAAIVVSAIVDRWTERRLARLSDHMLRDLGFERDWDGTVRSLRAAD